jgi:PAS domain S-box-containing protein
MAEAPEMSKRHSASIDVLVADAARRQSVATGVALALAVLALLATISQLRLPLPWYTALPIVFAGAGFVLAWWLAKRYGAHASGTAIVTTMLLQHMITIPTLPNATGAEHVGYFTAVTPLIAAATLGRRGVVVTGFAALASLLIEGTLSSRFGHFSAWRDFAPALTFFALMWTVGLAIVISGERTLRAYAAEQRRAQEATEQANVLEAQYRLVADHGDDLVSLVDAQGRYLYLSPSHERMLGMTSVRAGSMIDRSIFHPDDFGKLRVGHEEARQHGRSDVEARLRGANGEYLWFHIHFTRVEQADGSVAFVVAGREITEARRLTEALESTRRMEALGRLAGGVAHDFNNLLVVIRGCTELAQQRTTAQPVVSAYLTDIVNATTRAAALTSQLLTFARRQVLTRSRTRVSSALDELVPLLQRMVGSSVELIVDSKNSSIEVDASPVQIEQIVMNLASNAADAMECKGTIRIRLTDRLLETHQITNLKAGSYACLEVIDDGPGMPPEVLARVFDPFFTTKPAGKGTGLGLATVFGIATQMGGQAFVESTPGQGATFRIYLPAASAPAVSMPVPSANVHVADAKQPLRMLLVDDNEHVRTLIARLLREDGHTVDEAANGPKAIEHALRRDVRFDIVITDIVLGDDDGLSYFGAVREAQPDAAVLVISGFSPSPDRVAELTNAGAEFLPKPFSGKALFAAVARARSRHVAYRDDSRRAQ